jgi:predicted RNase H-like nuclease (RuvC/YqgF family)
MMIEQGRDDSTKETVDAIAQLATTTASDRGMVATLTTTNAKLANQLEASHSLIAQLKNEIATLKNKIKPAWQGQRPAKTTNNDSYCWSHGYQVAKSHTSATCNIKRMDIKILRRRPTPWVECNGSNNNVEGQLRK